MKDYILYLSCMVIGACMWNVWSHIKYLESSNDILRKELVRLLQEKMNDTDLAIRERDSGTACE